MSKRKRQDSNSQFLSQCLNNVVTQNHSFNDDNVSSQQNYQESISETEQLHEIGGDMELHHELQSANESVELNDNYQQPEQYPINYPTDDGIDIEDERDEQLHQDKRVQALKFYTKNRLTKKALNELLGMLDLDIDSKQFYKYFNIDEYNKIHFCHNCGAIEKPATLCKNCKKDYIKRDYFFYYVPLVESFNNRLKHHKKLLDLIDYYRLHYLFSQNGNDTELIDDIYKGDFYLKYVKPITSARKSISFTYNSDGVSPFKSSSFSFWPIFLTINELKPIERKKVSNVLLPVLIKCLPPKVLEKALNAAHYLILKDLREQRNNRSDVYFVDTFRYIADLPARSKLLLIKSSGYYFCHVCNISGKQIELRVTNQQQVPNSSENSSSKKKQNKKIVYPNLIFHVMKEI